MIKKCSYCGKEYKKSNIDVTGMSDATKERLEYIPDCNCLHEKFEEQREKERKELEIERKRIVLENKINKYKKISVVDKKFNESTFEKADKDKIIKLAAKYTKALLEKNDNFGLMLYGNVGTGKTYASACIANKLMSKGKTVLAISLSQYLSKIRQEWDEAENKLLEAIETCDLLILDDFGIEKSSEWVEEKIFNLVDRRYRAEKSMVITTNLIFDKDPEKCEFMEKLDKKGRIRDRIVEMCFPYFVEGESKRKIKSAKDFADFIN